MPSAHQWLCHPEGLPHCQGCLIATPIPPLLEDKQEGGWQCRGYWWAQIACGTSSSSLCPCPSRTSLVMARRPSRCSAIADTDAASPRPPSSAGHSRRLCATHASSPTIPAQLPPTQMRGSAGCAVQAMGPLLRAQARGWNHPSSRSTAVTPGSGRCASPLPLHPPLYQAGQHCCHPKCWTLLSLLWAWGLHS